MKNKNVLVWIMACLFTLPVMAEREKHTINDGWKFHKGELGQEVVTVGYDDSQWERVNIPHTWNTEAYVVKNYYKGVAWYRKLFSVLPEWKDRQVFIHLEGASKEAKVFVNGKEVGHHIGGYTASTFDITPFIECGGVNTLAIQVDNSSMDIVPISADFTFFGGIYRDVWLSATAKQHIHLTNMGSEGVFIHTPTVNEKEGTIAVRTEVKNDALTPANLELRQDIYAPDGTLAQTFSKRLKLKANELLSVDMESKPVLQPMLWTPETPNL